MKEREFQEQYDPSIWIKQYQAHHAIAVPMNLLSFSLTFKQELDTDEFADGMFYQAIKKAKVPLEALAEKARRAEAEGSAVDFP